MPTTATGATAPTAATARTGATAPTAATAPTERRNRPTWVVVAGIVVVVLAGAGLLGFSIAGGRGGRRRGPAVASGYVPGSSDPATAARETALAFLGAWSSRQLAQAAAYTDAPGPAYAALSAYAGDLGLSGMQASLDPATSSSGQSVAFAVTAQVGADRVTAVWRYHSALTAYERAGRWFVRWSPSVLAPGLSTSTHLEAVATKSAGASSVTDSAGDNLLDSSDPGLSELAQTLAHNAPAVDDEDGLEVIVETSTGKQAPNTTPVVLVEPRESGSVATTINARVEAAAESAAHRFPHSAMVVIQPTTGDIVAIANNDGQNHTALTGRVAPGSDFKVITSTALLDQGVVTPSQIVDCPQAFPVQGVVFHNDSDGENLGKPFIDDFAQSCNNAFDRWYTDLGNGALEQTAQTYYGLNRPWDIGIGEPTSYTDIPDDPSGAELAQECFGQGQLLVSPIAMASVAATVAAGSFHQPVLVPGAAQIAATPLPAATDADLKEMMRAVVTYPDGTGYGVGFGPDVYAKTGTADVGTTQTQPNSWMIAFDPDEDLAVGTVVLDAGYGASYAGPEVKGVFDALG
ncbi:MAG TPA: penicillin-binding transpeptidase domain-containing protein [Actinospica sp.]|nr:penicillin-binding transpeptidase domain-containing protein [Actinospica sp.]